MPNEYRQEEAPKMAELIDEDVADMQWADYIKENEDLETKQNETENAEKFKRKWEVSKEKIDTGKITDKDYFAEIVYRRMPEERKHTKRCGLESEDLTYDPLGDVAKDWDFMLSNSTICRFF